jgi:hypothetical protein
LGFIAVGIILFGIWGFRLYKTTRSLLGYMEQGMALVEGDPMKTLREDPETLGALMHGVREDIVAVNRQVGWLVPLGPAFGWVPKVGPLLADAPDLLTLADGLTEAGVVLWDHFSPALSPLLDSDSDQGEEEMTKIVARTLQDAAPHLPPARRAVQRASAAYDRIEVTALPGRFQGPMAQLGTLLPLLEDGLAFAEIAPQLLGVDEPRTYLVLAFNESELRPIGGFITAVGEVHVQAGRIVTMTFHDSYAVDDFSQPYPTPPEPLQRFLAIDLWVFRDSNWSPDFPTSVRQGLALYRPDAMEDPAEEIDGVIALDQWAVQQMVEAVEPVSVPGFEAALTGETVMDYVYERWAPDEGEAKGNWWRQRKSFMKPLAMAVFQRVQGGNVDWAKLARIMLDLLDEKHVLLYFAEPQAEALLAERGWAGTLQAPKGDYLMVVEANMGFNKVSANIERSFRYEVDLTKSPPRADARLTYTNTSMVDYVCEPEARYDGQYEQMMARCYWADLRLYVPEGANLLDATRHPIPADAIASGRAWEGTVETLDAQEGAYTVFHQALLLPTRSQSPVTTDVALHYALPDDIITQEDDGSLTYRLDIQKQPGLVSMPLRVVLRLPQNALLLNVNTKALTAHHEPAVGRGPGSDSGLGSNSGLGSGNVLLFDLDLKVDQQIVVSYRLGAKEGR